jgi:hypothetical protein
MLTGFGFWSGRCLHHGSASGCNEEVDDNVEDMEDDEAGTGDHAYDDD